ncbi:MAG TPA: extracellular solute-binding protein [Candidatus Limnocylindrales bacterium]|nr:extracellular solute-binding protein [Candidatus Limnocylindrales bacterium]
MDERGLYEEALAGRLSRREVLRRALALGMSYPAIAALLAACAGPAGSPGASPGGSPGGSPGTTPGGGPSGATALDFVVWSYSVETILDNIKQWEATNKDITVKLTDYPWNAYHETMVQRFSSNTSTDVLYNGGDWLPEFAKAGWVVPIEDQLDFAKYRDQIVGYALSDMTYEGKVYGLPYYADIVSFIWNPTVAKKHGVDRAPGTWEELGEMATTMQGKGLAKPIIWEFAQTLPTSLETFTAMVMGRGGELFDEQFQPIFEDPSSPGYQQLTFMAESVKKGYAVISPHETEVAKAMNTGQHAFTVLYNYNLAALNNKGTSPLAGQFELAMMPGSTHETLGFCKFYNMTKMAVDRGPDVAKATARFIEAFGGAPDGQYTVAKRWAVEKGLGFGQLPLFDDADVQKSFATWVDVAKLKEQEKIARGKRQTVWTGIWGEQMRTEMGKALAGEASVADALKAAADKARELKQQYG